MPITSLLIKYIIAPFEYVENIAKIKEIIGKIQTPKHALKDINKLICILNLIET